MSGRCTISCRPVTTATAPCTKGMAMGKQTDKSFRSRARSCAATSSTRDLCVLTGAQDILPRLVLNGGELQLKPERRFDAAVLSQMTMRRTKHG